MDGEHEYARDKEYDFELAIPAQQSAKTPEGTLGDIAGAAAALAQMTGMAARPPQWYIKASLDIPGGRDINKKIQVNVV